MSRKIILPAIVLLVLLTGCMDGGKAPDAGEEYYQSEDKGNSGEIEEYKESGNLTSDLSDNVTGNLSENLSDNLTDNLPPDLPDDADDGKEGIDSETENTTKIENDTVIENAAGAENETGNLTGVQENKTGEQKPDKVHDECYYKKGDDRDSCYLNLAKRNYNKSLCELIDDSFIRDFCDLLFEVDPDRTAVLEGYVSNKTHSYTREGYEDLRVDIYSYSKKEIIDSDETDYKGFYKVIVPAKDRYDVIVRFYGENLTQTVSYASEGFYYQKDFRITEE